MRPLRGLVLLVGLILTGLLLVWGIWLLVAEDPDGGRRAGGAVVVLGGLVVGVAVAASFLRRRSRSA